MNILFPAAVVSALLTWGTTIDTWQTLWIERWYLLVFVLAVYGIWQMRWRRWVYPACLTYGVGSALYAASSLDWGLRAPSGASASMTLAGQHAALSGLLCLGAFCLFCTFKRFPWQMALMGGGCLQAGGIFWAVLHGGASLRVPFLNNPSMAGTFVALTLAPASWPLAALGALAVCFTTRHIPLAVFTICLLMRVKSPWGLVTVGVWGAILAFFFYIAHPLNGRDVLWGEAAHFWDSRTPLLHLFGTGLGSSRIILPALDIEGASDLRNVVVHLWLHNDWMQILFELGWIGLAFAVVAGAMLFWDAPRSGRAFLAGYAVAMLGNMPLHWAATALPLWVLIERTALWRDGDGFKFQKVRAAWNPRADSSMGGGK